MAGREDPTGDRPGLTQAVIWLVAPASPVHVDRALAVVRQAGDSELRQAMHEAYRVLSFPEEATALSLDTARIRALATATDSADRPTPLLTESQRRLLGYLRGIDAVDLQDVPVETVDLQMEPVPRVPEHLIGTARERRGTSSPSKGDLEAADLLAPDPSPPLATPTATLPPPSSTKRRQLRKGLFPPLARRKA
jgi:hypothetical protein